MNIGLSPRAQKHFLAYSKPERQKIVKKFRLLEEQPFAGKKLGGEFAGFRTIRAWPYRIIYSIDQRNELILIADILHRQGAYK